MLLYCVVIEILTHLPLRREKNKHFTLEMASHYHCQNTWDSGTYFLLFTAEDRRVS